MEELSMKDLEQVTGGGIDWKLFFDEVLNALVSGRIQPTAALKDLIEAGKAKDWMSVATKAIPLAATDPVIGLILAECRI